MTIREHYAEYIKKLSPLYDRKEAATIADWIFEDIAKITRLTRITNGSTIVEPAAADLLKNALIELQKSKPVQYVLGEAWFFKLKLKVNKHVLIPRPETEELVQWILEDAIRAIEKDNQHQPSIIDIGSGSGCIAIALSKNIVNAEVLAIDISANALKVAISNAQRYGLPVSTRQLDFLDTTTWNTLPKYDVIVSNPPYIPIADKHTLAPNVVAHEPGIALFAGEDPLIFYKNIALFGMDHLKADGSIYVEIHEDFGKDVLAIFQQHSFSCALRKDIFGRDRMVKASKV